MKLTPYGFNVVPKEKYLVIESFGVGNIPTEGQFYEWVKENAKKEEKDRTLIVNISQVYQSVILNLYATGN
jgi:L-asparaginase/Glu-tRNA(Gln) amidotransferase subunit D